MNLPQTTIDRIEREATEKHWGRIYPAEWRQGYATGGRTEATRALPLYEALNEIAEIVMRYHLEQGNSPAANHARNIALYTLASYDAGEAPEPGKEAKGEIPPRVAFQVLAVKQALVEKNIEEAYHQLYQIASPDFDKYEPWAELEELAKQWQQSKNQQR